MATLPNSRHERFAQELANGTEAGEAYEIAGYERNDGNARRLRMNEAVSRRIEAILREREHIHAKAVERAIEKTGISIGRVLEELAKIGFSDIRKAVRWQSARITEQDNPDGGDVLVIKNVVTNLVQILGSDEIDDETAGAIAEISQTESGGVKIKLHDKRSALVDIGRHLGMFPTKVEMKATIERRSVDEFSDEELENIIAGSGSGRASEAEAGQEGPDSVH